MRMGPTVMAMALLAGPAYAEPLETPRIVLCDDLNGDARLDSAIVTFTPDRNGQLDHFRIVLGRDSIVCSGSFLHGTATVVDVDTLDGFREIAVPEWGPSEDDAVHFVRYSEAGLQLLGLLPGRMGDEIHVDGTGVIRTRCRGNLLHTWWYPCWYQVFAESGVLGEVPQVFKTMNTQVRLKRDLPLFPSPAHRQVTAVIHRGEWATIEVTDDREWCRIRSGDGVSGWFRLDEFGVRIDAVSIPPRDVFEGLVFVD